METFGSKAYLVNTGWDGSGERISIKATRAIIDAILDGSIDAVDAATLPVFNLTIPTDGNILDPRDTYQDRDEWATRANKLAGLFIENFAQYTDTDGGRQLVSAGPILD